MLGISFVIFFRSEHFLDQWETTRKTKKLEIFRKYTYSLHGIKHILSGKAGKIIPIF